MSAGACRRWSCVQPDCDQFGEELTTAMEPTHATAMRLGEMWLAQRGCAYQASRDSKSPSSAGGSVFA